jgi:FG-GAP repeat protein
MRTPRSLALTVAAALALGGAVMTAPSAAAATCDPDAQSSRGDLDGDNISDVVVGMPDVGEGSGAIDVRGTNSPGQQLTSDLLGGSRDDNDQVGTAIAVGDLDGDGCADLVVGAPGEGNGQIGHFTGEVHLVFGGPGGVDRSTAFVIPTSADPFDRFGAALALEKRGSGHDLYVGAPEATVGGKEHAGEVYRYTITPGGPRRVTVTPREVVSQVSAGVPGSAETGDRFGSVLASVGTGRGVLVGDPLEDIGSRSNAGAVWFLRVDDAGAAVSAQSFSQDTPGVVGAPEAGDHFGAAIGMRGRVAGIGVPDENDGKRADSGMVQMMILRAGNDLFYADRGLTQASPGVPGALEAGDRFGAQVVVGEALLCQENIDVAVGSPGEDVGTRANAGTVTLLSQTGAGDCPGRVVRQGSGMAGAAEAGDEVGSVVAITRGRTDLDEDYSDRLLVGVPKEDIGARPDAGLVQPIAGGIVDDGVLKPTLQFPGGYLLGTNYGRVLSSSSD